MNRMLSVLCITCFVFTLTSCASSPVSRGAANAVDNTIDGSQSTLSGAASGDIANRYANASQSSKGALIGGATGAVAGLAYSSVGVIPGVVTGAILGASYGAYIDSKASVEDQLINRGLNVMTLGDNIMIVIPSHQVFVEGTNEIKPSSYPALKQVADYIKPYTKTLVKIAVYTNVDLSKKSELATSKQQAKNIAKVLNGYGMNARLVVAEGYGSSRLVESVGQSDKDGGNDRVEITLIKKHV